MEIAVPTISFIILSWNSASYLSRCLDSLAAKCDGEGVSFEAIVVDNGSTDSSPALVARYAKERPGSFRLIRLEQNCGTTRSRNLGLQGARGRFLCVLDSDTEMGPGTLTGALRLLETKKAAFLAPRLLLPDGSVQHSVKRFPTMLDKLSKVPRILLRLPATRTDFYRDFPFAEDREVDTAISACWIFGRELMEEVGYLDERIFYSPEDLDYCIRVRKKGYRILYHPALTVLHHTQQITHKKPFSRTSLSHLAGLFYYFGKHGGWLARPSLEG